MLNGRLCLGKKPSGKVELLIGETTASETATSVRTTGCEKVVIVRVGERSVKVRRD